MPADHAPPGEIERDDLVLVEARAGKARQRAGVDMRFVEAVVTGDQSRQHAGIRRVHLAADQGEAHARDRLHAEHAQHRDVGMAGADQHHVLDHRMVTPCMSSRLFPDRVTDMSVLADASVSHPCSSDRGDRAPRGCGLARPPAASRSRLRRDLADELFPRGFRARVETEGRDAPARCKCARNSDCSRSGAAVAPAPSVSPTGK